ncbi:hypothetical protein Hypma_011917 [Hypsizygus marmoreus]|uniref:F-box domain-containing protein n=1 Tax=Hypsizygus marmoreus TaxID=39966 RepID=A0A369JLR8_HYPMA|nr:hypothetical protein Hypma_011917 [Hypsizygus marmoreus]
MSTLSQLPGLRIPLELIDEVFEYCTSDRHLLAVLSLVCKAYIELSRRHLFSELNITSKQDAQAFMELLESPLCTFNAPYIVAGLELLDEAQDPSWYPSALATLDTFLPELSELAVVLFEVIPASEQLLAMHPVFRHLVQLRLTDVRTKCGEDVLKFAASFPELHDLFVEGGSYETVDVSEPSYQFPTSIDNLWLSGDWVQIGLLWCLASPEIPIIPTLTLDGYYLSSSGEDEVSAYLAHLGPDLESLSLNFEFAPDDFHPTNFLSNHAGLTDLRLFGRAGPVFQTLIAMLPCMHTPNLDTIEIEIKAYVTKGSLPYQSLPVDYWPIEIDTLPWAELDALFAQSTFTSAPLEIILGIDARSFLPKFASREVFEAEITGRMPLSCNKELLTLSHGALALVRNPGALVPQLSTSSCVYCSTYLDISGMRTQRRPRSTSISENTHLVLLDEAEASTYSSIGIELLLDRLLNIKRSALWST